MRKLKLLHTYVAFFAIDDSAQSPRPLRSHSSAWLGRHAPRLALLLVLLSLVCYFSAAQLYPGGRPFDQGFPTYSHLSNYLCDLFAQYPYGRKKNPARLFGIMALMTLSLSLLPIYFALPYLTRSRSTRLIPLLGSAGGLSACLIFTPLHDEAIVFAFGVSLVAFLLSLFALVRAGFVRLAVLGLWPLFMGTLNFSLWKFRLLVPEIPWIQKVAIVGLMLWILSLALVIQFIFRRDLALSKQLFVSKP